MMLGVFQTALLVGTAAVASGFKQPIASPIAIWTTTPGQFPMVRSAFGDIQQLMSNAINSGTLWFQDRYLTTLNASDRYPEIFGNNIEIQPTTVYVAGRNLFDNPDDLPKEIKPMQDIHDLQNINSSQVIFYDISTDGGKTLNEFIMPAIRSQSIPAVIISGSITAEDSEKIMGLNQQINQEDAKKTQIPTELMEEGGNDLRIISDRRLQETPTDTPTEIPTEENNYDFRLKQMDLPALFYLSLFVGIATIGISMLHSIDGPVAFEDKLLQINKEY